MTTSDFTPDCALSRRLSQHVTRARTFYTLTPMLVKQLSYERSGTMIVESHDLEVMSHDIFRHIHERIEYVPQR